MLMNEETSRLYTMATIDDANVKSSVTYRRFHLVGREACFMQRLVSAAERGAREGAVLIAWQQ